MTNKGEQGYLDILRNILEHGAYRKPKDEEGRYELFAQQLRFDLSDGKLPLMTTKKVFTKGAIIELLWFLSGSQNIKMLTDNNIHIWDIWADEHGNVGPLYGYQWRHWRTDQHYLVQEAHKGAYEIDQVTEVMNSLRNKPEARSHVISAWRPDHLKLMSIKPCHVFLQFYLVNGELSLHMTQRSCDAFLGVPFNIAQYSALVHMIAQQLGVKAKEFIWTGNDVHIYENHVDQVKEQLLNTQYAFPTLTFNRKPDSIFDYKWEDFQINHYVSAGTIKADVSAQGTPGICTNLPEFQRFKYDDHVEKIAGAIFSGRVRGYYHTDLTETGYAIEADAYPGTVQIYPENALKPKE